MTIISLTLLLSVGDWVDANPAVTVALVIQFIAFVVWLAKLDWGHRQTRSDVSEMNMRIDSTENGLHLHLNDRDAHVNQLYIGSLAGRIDKLETTVEQSTKELRQEITSGHRAISQEIAQLASRIK